MVISAISNSYYNHVRGERTKEGLNGGNNGNLLRKGTRRTMAHSRKGTCRRC